MEKPPKVNRTEPYRAVPCSGKAPKDKCVLPMIKHGGGNVMVWDCMSAVDMYCDILKQSMIPSLWRLGRRALFQHENDPKHTYKTTTAFLKKLRVNVMDWPSMSPDLNSIEHLSGILKRKVEECKVSNVHQLRDVAMEEWKRTPVATCEALVNSMPKRVKAVLENNGAHTKYLGHFGHFHLGVYSHLWPVV